MTAVNRYVRHGRPASEGAWHAAQYRPGEPLDDLAAVLSQIPPGAQMTEVEFPLGDLAIAVCAVADPPMTTDQWLIVEPWAWLAANGKTGFITKIARDAMGRDWELVT